MKSFIAAFVAMITIASCTKNNSVNTPDSRETEECYTYLSEKDTIKISLTIVENSASGDLVYNFYEKDKNVGVFKGTLSGDSLVGEYEFRSEGMMSTRGVSFVRKGSVLVDESGLELKKVECK